MHTNHVHAVTSAGSNTYSYDANGNQITRVIGADTYNLKYDAENRLVEVKKNNVVIAAFTFDGDGKRVKSVINGTTTLFVGGGYEIKNPGTGQEVTKYYFAGASRVAMRKYVMPQSPTVNYMLYDHLGSTNITTDTNGAVVTGLRYKAWGEVRYPTNGTNPGPSKYTYTGQYSNVDDFGLMFYNARWYDPYLNHLTQPDSIVSNSYNSQDWDRYSYTRNNPLRYTDPSGHLPLLIAIGLVAVDYLVFTGKLPDMKGTAITVALADTNDATVAAGIAVQSEWLGPQDIPAVMSVYDSITGTDPDSHNYGLAQTNASEMEDLEICGECNPWDTSLADDTIAARIQNGLNDCKLCGSGVDKLVASALAQNGFDTRQFSDLQQGKDGNLDWSPFLEQHGSRLSDTVAKLRQNLTGLNYDTELMLKLYVNDLRLLLKLGYELPEGITEDDIEYIEDNYLQ